MPHPDLAQLAQLIKQRGRALGFQQVGIADVDLECAEQRFMEWLAAGFHGSMAYMAKHGALRSRPAQLVPGTVRVIAARMQYFPQQHSAAPHTVLEQPELGYIARYALGRDYHKVLRQRLQQLAAYVASLVQGAGYRVFVDSAPVMEKALAAQAGLGWVGKHSILLERHAGSWFCLGVIYVDVPLPVDAALTAHCGTCNACILACPTQAIVAPYCVDARRCVAYLTIEAPGAIPVELRHLIGNRIYGCDDCQAACPWNRRAAPSTNLDFALRHGLDAPRLVELFTWDEAQFLERTTGSAIRRIGHERWLRNIAVALGNAPPTAEISAALHSRASHASALVREHVAWALQNLTVRGDIAEDSSRNHTLLCKSITAPTLSCTAS